MTDKTFDNDQPRPVYPTDGTHCHAFLLLLLSGYRLVVCKDETGQDPYAVSSSIFMLRALGWPIKREAVGQNPDEPYHGKYLYILDDDDLVPDWSLWRSVAYIRLAEGMP
jgi:hypothetical protein